MGSLQSSTQDLPHADWTPADVSIWLQTERFSDFQNVGFQWYLNYFSLCVCQIVYEVQIIDVSVHFISINQRCVVDELISFAMVLRNHNKYFVVFH